MFNKQGDYITFTGKQHQGYNTRCAPSYDLHQTLSGHQAHLQNNRLILLNTHENILDYLNILTISKSGKEPRHRIIIGNLYYRGDHFYRIWKIEDSLVVWYKYTDSIYNVNSIGRYNPRFVIRTNSDPEIKDSMIVESVLESRDYIFADMRN